MRGLWIQLRSSWDPLSSSLLQVSLREPPGSAHQPLTFFAYRGSWVPTGGATHPLIPLCHFASWSSVPSSIKSGRQNLPLVTEDSGQCR